MLFRSRQPLLADEHDDRELRVAPARVAEQLVDGLSEARRPLPELALADEEVAPVVAPYATTRGGSNVRGAEAATSLAPRSLRVYRRALAKATGTPVDRVGC